MMDSAATGIGGRRMPRTSPLLTVLALCAASALAACGSSGDGGSRAGGDLAPATAATARAGCARTGGPVPASVPGAPLRTLLRVPPTARGHRAPLVVALHFATGDGAAMERQTRLTPEARRAGFVIAYPTATAGGFWEPSDLPKLARTIAAIERAACIDRSRVYALGWSNGGGMAALAACRMADTVAAVALFAPAVDTSAGCRPSRPVSVLEVHGTADAIVPYAAGRSLIGGWAARDGCRATPVTHPAGAKAARLRWSGCRGGAAVEHLRLDGGRHVELFDDLRAAGVDPGAVTWRFLAAHRLT